MCRILPIHPTLEDWVKKDVVPCPADSPGFNAAVDQMVAAVGPVELLGFGEALHGGEDILLLRNRLFQRLVEKHGYCAIAIESSFTRGRAMNEYVLGCGPDSYAAAQEAGFSLGFGKLDANREFIEWLRRYNADPSHPVKVHFYGFDQPGVTAGPASPRQTLEFVLDYLAPLDSAGAQKHRDRITPLLGNDADWENPMAWRDPAKADGLLKALDALRLQTENLITELRTRRPEWVAGSDATHYQEARHHAQVARELLNFFDALARGAGYADSLAVRDAAMADNLAYIVSRERGRGKVFAFAHNAHLQRGQVTIQLGPQLATWWPAGSHVNETLGARYAVIGSAVGVSEANGIAQPEPDTLEARLTATPGPVRFIPTHRGQSLPSPEVAGLPVRAGSRKNPTYVPLKPQSLTDFDWIAVLDSTTYTRGGRPLQ